MLTTGYVGFSERQRDKRQGLRKSYGEQEAVAGIDFAVGSGEVLSFLESTHS
jgi:ABC-type histidine transport system ATPase subunit